MDGKMMGHTHKGKRREAAHQMEEAMMMSFDWGRGCMRDKVEDNVSDRAG